MAENITNSPGTRIVDNRELDIELCGAANTLFLRNFWLRLPRDSGELPRYDSVELMDLYPIADTLIVKDVTGERTDFFNRFWGSRLTYFLGFEGTGHHVSDYEPEVMRQSLLKRYGRIAETGKPELLRGHFRLYDLANVQRYEVLHVPLLGSKGSEVQHIMSVFDFDIDPLVE